MEQEHRFAVEVEWTGNRGSGTSSARAFEREHIVRAPGKPELAGSAAPVFRGDAARWNPEELLIAALSQCHMMSYFYAAVQHGIVVTGYRDAATGVIEMEGAAGQFTSVTLRPEVTVSPSEALTADPGLADRLHDEAERLCFIARSVNFPVHHEPTTRVTAG
ncbi:OsmC family protein [Ruicaihuangia caeni]|uniref:OsmC family protein n=1 Tax=Ruicaihuangia caeni TaxID=3042517 RepID=A0AAW6T7X7_9MICO|nr:OsmC family protein [Klugiella sp. YN-L-19]MDI2097500.1 OsmC family protein [Klugiella sp. YN-L-19]